MTHLPGRVPSRTGAEAVSVPVTLWSVDLRDIPVQRQKGVGFHTRTRTRTRLSFHTRSSRFVRSKQLPTQRPEDSSRPPPLLKEPALPCPALPCPTLSYPATCWPCFDLPFAWLSLRDSKRRRARLERLTVLSLRSLFCRFLPCVK